MAKVVIVGSGLAGLTAGAYLSEAGYQVEIFEQDDHLGGITGTLCKEGYAWDLGPLTGEAFGAGEPVGKILDELGIRHQLQFVRADRGVIFPDFSIIPPAVYQGPYWRRERLKEIFPHESEGLDRYYRFYDTIMDLMTLDRHAKATSGLFSLLLKLPMMPLYAKVKHMVSWNAQQLMDLYFTDPKLKAIFLTLLADFTVRPSEFMALGIPQLNPESQHDRRIPPKLSWSRRRLTYHFSINGWGSVVHSLEKLIRANGGRLFINSPVGKIELKGNRVSGIVLESGERIQADLVLVTGGAKEFMLKLVGRNALRADLADTVEKLPMMESVFMVHLGLDMDPTPYQDAPVRYYYNSYDVEHGISLVQNGVYHEGRDGFVIYIPSLHSPEMAPAGHYAITVFTIAPNKLEGGWEARRKEMVEKLLQEAERFIPGLRNHAQVSISLTPEDFRRRTHLDHHSFAGLRPVMGTTGLSHRTPFEGLWFLGAQSESMGGVNNVMLGARNVFRMIRCKT